MQDTILKKDTFIKYTPK